VTAPAVSVARRRRRGPRLAALAAPDWVLVAVVCLAPIGYMISRAFGEANPITLDVELTGSVESFRTLLSGSYRPVIARSYALAAATVLLCLVIGTPTALALSRMTGRRRTIGVVALLLPSFVSFTVRIFALQGVLATGGPVESVFGVQWLFKPPAVLIGMVTAYVPLFVVPAYVALSRVPRSMIEASADLGARHVRQMASVTLPLAAPGIATGAILVGVLAVGEFIIPAVLGGGKVLLLGNILSERGAGRDQPLGGAITTLLLATTVVAALTVVTVRRLTEHHRA
jgi:spermidine/putrescine transport system permease protein